MSNPFNPFAHKTGEQIMATWQARALRGSEGKLQHVLFTAMVNEYSAITQNTWLVLLGVIIPKFNADQPFLNGYAKIMPSGRVVSEVFYRGDRQLQMIYRSKDEFISEMRKLADKLKLDDLDRVAMFALLGKWIAADLRVGVEGELVH